LQAAYLEMQRGLVLSLTGRPGAAAKAGAAGLAGLEPGTAASAWTDQYRELLSAEPADSPPTGRALPVADAAGVMDTPLAREAER
jgi:hypothetical protein